MVDPPLLQTRRENMTTETQDWLHVDCSTNERTADHIGVDMTDFCDNNGTVCTTARMTTTTIAAPLMSFVVHHRYEFCQQQQQQLLHKCSV